MARGKRRGHPTRPTSKAPTKPAEQSRVSQAEMFPQAVQYEKKTTYFAGPLPAPDSLFQYEQIAPGAADRIIGMAEREAQHRHQMETGMLRIHGRNSTLGVISASLLGVTAVGGGAYGMTQGADLGGAAIALTALAGLIGVFFFQRRRTGGED